MTTVVKEANSLVENGKYSEAYDLLLPHDKDFRTFNIIGVALMMQKRFEEAMPWFEKALQAGCQSARNNIDAIIAEYEYETQQKKEIEEYLNKYN